MSILQIDAFLAGTSHAVVGASPDRSKYGNRVLRAYLQNNRKVWAVNPNADEVEGVAFPYDTAPRYLIFDRDSIFSPAVVEFIRAMGTKPVRISFRSPWQNGTAERWIGSCRRELLEHVVVLGERHLVRLVRAYIT